MMIRMDAHEEALAKKYGFIVSDDGTGHFVVHDPQLPKRKKFVGGNLYSLMLRAVDERKRLNIPPPSAKVIDLGKKPTTSAEVVPLQRAKLDKKPEAPPTPVIKGKLYLIKRILLENLNASVATIDTALRADGLVVSISTISTVRSDFLHSVRVIKEMNRWREG